MGVSSMCRNNIQLPRRVPDDIRAGLSFPLPGGGRGLEFRNKKHRSMRFSLESAAGLRYVQRSFVLTGKSISCQTKSSKTALSLSITQ
jgi:hypothetical protein